jgi:hypothetical protein
MYTVISLFENKKIRSDVINNGANEIGLTNFDSQEISFHPSENADERTIFSHQFCSGSAPFEREY